MEVNVLDWQGVEQEYIVQIRAGHIRRQARIGARVPFEFPTLPVSASPLKVEVYRAVCSRSVTLSPDAERYIVRLPPYDGLMEESKLQLDIKEAGKEASARAAPRLDEALPSADSKTAKDEVAADARNFLHQHNLLSFVQDMLVSLMTSRPDDPFGFMGLYAKSQESAAPSQQQPTLQRCASDAAFGEDDGNDISNARRTDDASGDDVWYSHGQGALQWKGENCILTTMVNSRTKSLRFELLQPNGETVTVHCTNEQFEGLVVEQAGLEGPARDMAAIRQMFAETMDLLQETPAHANQGTSKHQPEVVDDSRNSTAAHQKVGSADPAETEASPVDIRARTEHNYLPSVVSWNAQRLAPLTPPQPAKIEPVSEVPVRSHRGYLPSVVSWHSRREPPLKSDSPAAEGQVVDIKANTAFNYLPSAVSWQAFRLSPLKSKQAVKAIAPEPAHAALSVESASPSVDARSGRRDTAQIIAENERLSELNAELRAQIYQLQVELGEVDAADAPDCNPAASGSDLCGQLQRHNEELRGNIDRLAQENTSLKGDNQNIHGVMERLCQNLENMATEIRASLPGMEANPVPERGDFDARQQRSGNESCS